MAQKQIDSFSYATNSVLGEGSTGTVYLGTDRRNGRQIAIKAIDMKNIDNDVTKYLLENEIKALQLSNHPNVLKAIEVIRRPDFCYVVTDYLQGKSLHDIIKTRGKLPEAEALALFRGIVEGYNNISNHHIVHRDLKPQNIMLTNTGNPVIVDFGYCEIGGFMAKPKMFYNVGSPAYMAPESIVSSQYNQNSDMWALGTILYQMIEGKPFIAASGTNIMKAIMNLKRNGIHFPGNSSETLKMILRECLKLKPTDRIKAKDLLKQLNMLPGGTNKMGTEPSFPIVTQTNHGMVQPVVIPVGVVQSGQIVQNMMTNKRNSLPIPTIPIFKSSSNTAIDNRHIQPQVQPQTIIQKEQIKQNLIQPPMRISSNIGESVSQSFPLNSQALSNQMGNQQIQGTVKVNQISQPNLIKQVGSPQVTYNNIYNLAQSAKLGPVSVNTLIPTIQPPPPPTNILQGSTTSPIINITKTTNTITLPPQQPPLMSPVSQMTPVPQMTPNLPLNQPRMTNPNPNPSSTSSPLQHMTLNQNNLSMNAPLPLPLPLHGNRITVIK